jgi:hypothetical protein
MPTSLAGGFADFHQHLQAWRFIGHDAFRCDESPARVTPGPGIPKRRS